MIIYKDVITGDELISDAYPIKLIGENKTIMQVKCKSTTMSSQIDDSLIGGNPSAEEGAEDMDSGAVSGIDVVLHFSLREDTKEYSKKEFKKLLQDYVKKVLAKKTEVIKELREDKLKKQADDMEAEMAAFKEGFTADLTELILKPWSEKSFAFYRGANLDAEGMIILFTWPDETPTEPFAYFVKFGLLEEKQ